MPGCTAGDCRNDCHRQADGLTTVLPPGRHHRARGNHNYNIVLYNAGKPAKGHMEDTIVNCREVSPTHVTNVLFGYAAIVEALRADRAMAESPFCRLDILNCMSASLSLHIWNELRALPLTNSDREIPILSGRGGTELGPTCTRAHWLLDLPGLGGVPFHGTEVRLVPAGNRLELRVKGPNATAGYREMADKTAEAFDELGYYRTGDAGELVDPASPEKGLRFRGRISENFKLATGSWVNVGDLRLDVIHAAKPPVKDVVVAGHCRSEICLVVIPEEDGMREIAGSSSPDSARDQVCDFLRSRLGEFNAQNPNSSRWICTMVPLESLPRLELNETTAKGYVNQRPMLDNRVTNVEVLHSDTPGDGVIALE